MARMFPAEIYTSTPSPGELEIFQRLRDDPATREWIVLHSLDVAHHLKQVVGEIDFVVIIPSKGVLCLEVKAHRRLRCEQGQWYYGNDPTPQARSPFKQAADGMQSIRARLVERYPELNNVVFWSACIFPYVEFTTESEEWHPWQVIDSYDFRRQPISQALLNVISQARRHLEECETARWFHPASKAPDAPQCKLIVETLRPEFEFFESPESQARRRTDELKRYTADQLIALDAMGHNARVIFEGPAGTGKTMLAIEVARRSSAASRRVLLLCYNRLLGHWLEGETATLAPQVTTTTLHRHMLGVAGLAGVAGQPGALDEDRKETFWTDELPGLAVDRLLADEENTHVFDEIIVDEAQDILRDSYLDFLDLSVRGGLASGRWRMFGDFEKQAIYGSACVTLDELMQKRTGEVPVYSIRVNCRNTPRIAEYTHLLGGLTPGYLRVLRPDDGVEPKLHVYRDGMHQQKLLIRALTHLYEDGFRGGEIVVLSPRRDVLSAAAGLDEKPWKDRLRPFGTASAGQIGYGSIHTFKGMEACAVVVTDIEHIKGLEATALFYVAITRALHRLVLLVHEPVREEVMEVILNRTVPRATQGLTAGAGRGRS